MVEAAVPMVVAADSAAEAPTAAELQVVAPLADMPVADTVDTRAADSRVVATKAAATAAIPAAANKDRAEEVAMAHRAA